MRLVLLQSVLLLVLSGFGCKGAAGNPTYQPNFQRSQSSAFKSECESFKNKIYSLPNVTVHSVTYVPIGGNISMADNPAVCATDDLTSSELTSTVEFCRVSLNVTTSSTSQVFMEAWLPSNYTGRFLSTGNGGLGGCIQYGDLVYATQFGFSTVGTNNGHFGDTGQYFLNNPEVLEDYAYRAIHTGVVVGKELTKSFYPQGFKKSYYMGCSTGGREGWKSVQKFPDDFDGVVAGSPAVHLIGLIDWGARFLIITGNSTSDTFVTADQWGTLIHDEILRQCDSLDGATDGIIEDTDLCQPIFETLMCNSTASTNSSSTQCLTGIQVNTVNQVFSPLYGENGELSYPRMQPGSEVLAAYVYYSGEPFQYAEDWFRYVVYNNTQWDPTSWTLADAAAAESQDPFQVQTWEGDLSAFQKKGGKVLHYHGLEDPIISSDNSKVYYKHVADTMSSSPSDLDDFYRFFPISGMGHCSPGSGASYIGQGLATYAGSDPEDNVLMAMVQWVEDGIAPEYVRGTKFASDGSVEYRRKHCKYPKRNQYVGPGNYTLEDAWECV